MSGIEVGRPMRILPQLVIVILVLTTPALVGCSNERDRADALKAADRIHSFVKQQDTASIYRESGDSFKQEGDEAKFRDGRGGGQVLPKTDANGKQITYREYDVHPKPSTGTRGTERIVRGSDGAAYYTSDHYLTFIKIE